MGAVRLNPTASQQGVGAYYEAAWTASSSAANLARLTNSITLPAGVYVIMAHLPQCSSTPFYAGLMGAPDGRNGTGALPNQGVATWVVRLTSASNVYLAAGQSAACAFSYTERGGLQAVRIA